MAQKMAEKLRKKMVIVFIAAAVFTAGCMGLDPGDKSTKTRITPDNMDRIAGMQWILKEMTVEGRRFDLTGDKPYIQFEANGKFGGFASINRFFGRLKMDETGLISPTPLGTTMMAGPEELAEQERGFLKAFEKTSRLYIDKIHLYAESGEDDTGLVFFVPVE